MRPFLEMNGIRSNYLLAVGASDSAGLSVLSLLFQQISGVSSSRSTKELVMKTCSICNNKKPLSEFHIRRRSHDGLTPHCKECHKIIGRKARRTKHGLIVKIYSHQSDKSKLREHPAPDYTRIELRGYLYSQPRFHMLFDLWKLSGYNRKLTPSLDRLDDYKPYTFSNIRLVTWDENNKKAYSDRKNGINNKVSKAVIGVHKDTGEVVEFHFAHQAEREIGVNSGNLTGCCVGRRGYGHAGGYKWSYKGVK